MDAHVLTGVIAHIITYLVLPGLDAGHAGIGVEEVFGRVGKFEQGILVDFAELLEAHEPLHEKPDIAPFVRILPAGIDYPTGSQRVVIIVRNEEELVVVEVRGIEIDKENVTVHLVVIPHSHGHVDCIGLEEQFHVTYFLDPFVETVLALAGQLEDEVLELGLGSLVCSLSALPQQNGHGQSL